MKNTKKKWFSLVVMMCIALSSIFSAVTALTNAFASGWDITVTMQNVELNAGETTTLTVYADANKDFSSYELMFSAPDFLDVVKVESEINGENCLFVYGNNHVTFSSPSVRSGYTPLFRMTVEVSSNAEGKDGVMSFYNSKFTDLNSTRLSVEELNATITVSKKQQDQRMKGDFDGNKLVNIQDVMYMQNYITGSYGQIDSDAFYAGDINNDGEIDIYDCQYVQSYLIGLIPSLENINGGEDKPQGDDFLGEYTYQTSGAIAYLWIRENRAFEMTMGGDTFSGTYSKEGYNLALVDGYRLGMVQLNVSDHTFVVGYGTVFSDERATATGYEGTYIANGNPDDTVAVLNNGAFVRTCYEEGIQVQYNGMIQILEEKDGMARGVAHIFGTSYENAMFSAEFTLDENENALYFSEGEGGEQGEEDILVSFFVNDEWIADYTIDEETTYVQLYDRFMGEYGKRIAQQYSGFDAQNYNSNNGVDLFSNEIITTNTQFTFMVKGGSDDEEGWEEITTTFDVYSSEGTSIYYDSTPEQVRANLIGKQVSVSKNYRNQNGETRTMFYKTVTLTKDMIGDLSKMDFSSESGSSYIELPLIIEGRQCKMYANLVPDMSNATLLKSAVAESRYYLNGEPAISYSYVEIYSNGYMAQYYVSNEGQVNREPNGYAHYDMLSLNNGTTLYAVGNPSIYRTISGTIKLGENTFQKLDHFMHTDGQETTDYTLTVQGMGDMLLKVFTVSYETFGEMYSYSNYLGSMQFSGTIKVEIKDGKITFMGMTYNIGEDNVLYIDAPSEEPLFTAIISGMDVNFYENGTATVCSNGQIAMTMDWTANDDMTIINCTMAGEQFSFYKWARDGQYHEMEEPDWESGTQIVLHDESGKTYSLFKFSKYTLLFDGENYERVSAGYQDNIFDRYLPTGEDVYYYYDETGMLYNAIRYAVVSADGERMGYMYAVPSKHIMVGYYDDSKNNIYIREGSFTYADTNAEYEVSYNGEWLFSATVQMKEINAQDNKLMVTSSRQGRN